MSELNDSEYLEQAEVRRLTGKAFKIGQKKALTRMGYPFEIDADGRPLVSRWFARNRACGIEVVAPSGPILANVR